MAPKIVIKSTHTSSVGGGEHNTIYLAKALSRFGAVYWDCDIHKDISVFSGIENVWPRYDGSFKPDIYIYMSHSSDGFPKGKRNFKFCFYPTQNNKPFWLWKWKYEAALCNSQFVAEAQKRVWGLPAKVVNPCMDLSKFSIGSKENIIINVGNFFYEENGHSKNQHLVVEWFKSWERNKDYELWLIGHNVHEDFVQKVKDMSNVENIKIKTDIPFSQLIDAYSRAKYMVHAMGYGRTLPHETEHFGMVAVEAMASGCQPIVHRSGGCKDIEGVRVWDEWNDIDALISETQPYALRKLAKHYDFEVMVDQLKSALHLA